MTRRVHAAATATSIVTGIAALAGRKWKLLAASPLLAYGPAFSSHWIWEKNNPVVLGKGKPIWAARADLEMVFKVLTGRIAPDVERLMARYPLDPNRAVQLMAEAGFTRDAEGFFANAQGHRVRLDFAVQTSTEVAAERLRTDPSAKRNRPIPGCGE